MEVGEQTLRAVFEIPALEMGDFIQKFSAEMAIGWGVLVFFNNSLALKRRVFTEPRDIFNILDISS